MRLLFNFSLIRLTSPDKVPIARDAKFAVQEAYEAGCDGYGKRLSPAVRASR
jgi:hypothetical protein